MKTHTFLQQVLAETYTVYLNTQKAHWNVTGPNFHGLHKMLEEQYEELAEAVDSLAERIRAIGALSPGSFSEFQKLSHVAEFTDMEADATKLLQALAHSHEGILKTLKDALGKVDAATEDMFIARIQEHEEALWMIKSTLK